MAMLFGPGCSARDLEVSDGITHNCLQFPPAVTLPPLYQPHAEVGAGAM